MAHCLHSKDTVKTGAWNIALIFASYFYFLWAFSSCGPFWALRGPYPAPLVHFLSFYPLGLILSLWHRLFRLTTLQNFFVAVRLAGHSDLTICVLIKLRVLIKVLISKICYKSVGFKALCSRNYNLNVVTSNSKSNFFKSEIGS